MEQRIKEDLINEIYKTDVKLHHSYKSVYYQLKHLSVERIESILEEIKYNHYICTIN